MKLLASTVVGSLTDAFVVGTEEAVVDGLVSNTGRELPTEDLIELVAEARARFERPEQSDRWLGPRLHSLLRLSRREAAAKEMWLYLSVVDCPDYVRWRFEGQRARFHADAVNHAFSRLWWSAELFRQGVDYGPATAALTLQEIPNTVLRLQAVQNQPFCAALLTFIKTRRSDGSRLIGRQINHLSTAINSQLFVAALDAVAPSAQCDASARRAWAERPVPLEELIDGDPLGPDDLVDPEFELKVNAALALLHRVADSANIATTAEPRAGSRRPGDLIEDDQDSALDE